MAAKKLLPSSRHSFYMMASLSSSFLHQPLFFPNPNPRFPKFQTRTLGFTARAGRDAAAEKADKPPASVADAEKKSLSVFTGEIFLGLASLLVRTAGGTRRRKNGGSASGEGEGEEEEEEAVRVVEDRAVIWEQREKDVEAEMERKELTSPGFSFSAAGLLFPYHLGVSQLLLEKGYIKETTPLAGSSAGAIICATIASGNTMQEALQATKILAEDCRLNGTAFRLGAVLRNLLDTFLPDDVHTKCNGRIRVAITQLLWRPRGLLVDQFDSKEDLINAVITSSFIPGYLAPRPATMFRNRLCIDGGLTLFIPPTSASKTVRVCAFPAGRLGLSEIGISPDCNPENRATPRQLLNWALEPAEDQILDRLYELGYLDAAVWADQNPLSSTVSEGSPNTRDLN